MVALKPGETERALARIDPRVALVLVYGPDAGLVAERARRVARAAVADPEDPFQLVRLDGDAVAADPGRLADEAATVAMFGAKRAVLVGPTTKNLAPAAEAALAVERAEALIVIEAGDLSKGAPLRALCEAAPRALVAPCYADEGAALEQIVDATLKEAGLRADAATRRLLVQSLGGDRLATRAELDKLVLYLDGRSEATEADVAAVLSDVSGLHENAVADAAFAGDAAGADEAYRRLRQEGTSPGRIASVLLGHALALAPLALDVAAGAAPSRAVEGWRGLHFKRKEVVAAQLGAWRPEALRALAGRLQETVLATRRAPDLADALVGRMVVDIARSAAARAQRHGRGR